MLTASDMPRSTYVVEEEGLMGSSHCLVQVSIRADDAGGLAAELQRHRDDIVSSRAHDDLAHLCAASKRKLRRHEGMFKRCRKDES